MPVLAIPSKGRLRAPTEALLEKAGHPVTASTVRNYPSLLAGLRMAQGNLPDDRSTVRSYPSLLAGLPDLRLVLVKADAIPGMLARGEAHAGITGMDLATESLPDLELMLGTPLRLGYGQAQLSLAVPECWIDVEDVTDLDDVAFAFRRDHGRRLRIATGFPRLARWFLTEHAEAEYEIVTSRGPTEAAPLAGLAEAVIDLVATGETLRANRLKRPRGGTLLESEAYFWISRTAQWDIPTWGTLATLRDKLAEAAPPAC